MTTQNFFRFVFGAAISISTLLLGGVAPVFAAGESASIQNISPVGAVSPGTTVMFSTAATGFIDPTYAVSDSFSAAGATVGTIDKIGSFTWTPGVYDAGKHSITVTVADAYSHTASATVTVVVTGTTVLVTNLTPGPVVEVQKPVTFTIVAPGFDHPTYAAYDSTAMNTLSSATVDATGVFSWTPTTDDLGAHRLTIEASDVYGHAAQTTLSITVTNPIVVTPATATTTSNASSGISPVVQNAVTATTVVPAVSSVGKYVFTTALSIGSRGTAVTELQKYLATLGFFSAAPTGYFGPLTAASVKLFQAAHGIAQVGNVGPITRAALNK